jgi:deoxycytidylate deaminase
MNRKQELILIRMIKDIVAKPHTWPGHYEKFLVMASDGEAICYRCVRKNEALIIQAIKDDMPGDHWMPWFVDDATSYDTALGCSNCNKVIVDQEQAETNREDER